MAQNPVTAFLAGFNAVDQFETNKQLRQFRSEQQSQLRKTWARQDELWARDQMAFRQQENFRQYQLTSEALMEEISMQAEKVYEAHASAGDVQTAEQAKASYLNQWFSNETMVGGKPAGFLRFSTEVVNRMIAGNPEFGEHIALSTGFDAADGPLVADPTKPVSGIIGIPPEADPEGKGGFVPQINATTNPYAPATKNRTASNQDPLYVGRVTPQVLSSLFGDQILTSSDRTAIMLRNQFGIEPGSVTQQAAEGGSGVAEQQPVPSGPSAAEQEVDKYFGPGMGEPGTAEESSLARTKDATRSRLQELRAANRQAEIDGNQPRSTGRFDEFDHDMAANITGPGEPTPREKITSAWKKEIRNIRNNPTAEEINAASQRAGAPESNEEAQQTAQDVQKAAATSSRVGRRPTTPEIYNALRLKAGGVLSDEQVMNYVQTGSFDGPAEYSLQNTANGVFAIDPRNPSDATLIPGTAPSDAAGGLTPATVQDQQRILNLLQDATAGYFDDEPQAQQRLIDGAEGAFTIIGLPGSTTEALDARANPDILNSIVRGGNYVRNFNADTAQNVLQGTGDFNPLPGSDLDLSAMTPEAIAMGFLADQLGVGGQKNANEFLYQYMGSFRKGTGLSGRALYLNVKRLEGETLQARMDAARDPSHPEHEQFKGKDRNELRRELVEEMVLKAGGG